MRICIQKSTNRVLEMQSGATEGTLLKNALNQGYKENDLEELDVDDKGYAAALAKDPVYIAQQKAKQDKKSEIESDIDAADSVEKLKAVLKMMVEENYFSAKNF